MLTFVSIILRLLSALNNTWDTSQWVFALVIIWKYCLVFELCLPEDVAEVVARRHRNWRNLVVLEVSLWTIFVQILLQNQENSLNVNEPWLSFSSQTKHQPLRLVVSRFMAGRKFSLSLPPYGYFVRSWSPFFESPLSYLKTVLFTFKIDMIKDMY